jgi:proteic killer suppression protein
LANGLDFLSITVSVHRVTMHLFGTSNAEASLIILFATRKIEKHLATPQARQREYGPDAARALRIRLANLADAADFSVMRTLPGHCHELHQDREGQLGVDLTKGLRLVFEPADDPVPVTADGGLDWHRVTALRILEVTDYHG